MAKKVKYLVRTTHGIIPVSTSMTKEKIKKRFYSSDFHFKNEAILLGINKVSSKKKKR